MQNDTNLIENNADIEYSKPSKSRFLFLIGFLGFFLFMSGCFYGVYTHKYRSNADVKVPDNTLYTPKYK